MIHIRCMSVGVSKMTTDLENLINGQAQSLKLGLKKLCRTMKLRLGLTIMQSLHISLTNDIT